jgi:hypothetical protein
MLVHGNVRVLMFQLQDLGKSLVASSPYNRHCQRVANIQQRRPSSILAYTSLAVLDAVSKSVPLQTHQPAAARVVWLQSGQGGETSLLYLLVCRFRPLLVHNDQVEVRI